MIEILSWIKNLAYNILGGLLLAMMISATHVTASVDDIARSDFDKFVSIAKECGESINDAELRVEVSYVNPQLNYYAITYQLYNLVVISYRNFMSLEPIKQQQVIFHELGHALLDLRHNDDDLNLMNTLGFIDEEDYKENYDYYIRKLFVDCERKEKFIYGQ